MIFYFIRMNYTPIDTIIKQLKNYKGTEIDNTQNEISMIETALEKIAFEHQDMRKKLSEQDEIIRRSVLEDMLKKGNIDNAQFETVLERNQITFRDERFRVITVYVENFEKLFEEEPALSNEKRFHYAKIIISNILNELLNETHYFICMELDGLFTGIINYKAASDIANVILTLEEAQSIIDHEFHFEFSVAVSSEKLQYAELAEAYAETIQIIKYRIFDEDSSIVLYDNIFEPDDSADYSFSSDIERQLMNCISVSDAENAIQFIDVVFAKACKNIRLSKYIMYDIMATFMKLAEKLPDEKKNTFHEKIYVLENLDMSNPTTNMLLEIKDIVKELCAVFSKAKSGESKTVLGIKSYIANTYMDINLSVYSIADHFSLTPSYVSKLFKRYTGDALLEYINKYRIEMAKQIMSDQEGYSIDKIAAMVGYENPRTFTRIFKKYESTVPSKYKNMLHGNT